MWIQDSIVQFKILRCDEMWVEKILQTKKPEKVHLENLIKEKRIEDANIEYKRLDIITNNDKESLISSVIGLAHGQGGLLILGMDDDKLLPKELIWGDAQVYTKERLESILRDNIDPIISLTIHPIINRNKIVFILDIPRSDRIHVFKKNNICYQRMEFQVRQMSPSDIEMFVKGAIHYSSCAYFRYQMKSEIHYWFDEVLGRIDPEYDYKKEIEEIQLIDRFEILLEMINQRKPLHKKYLYDSHNLIRVANATHLFASVIKDILKYDYINVTPHERILIQKISGIIRQDNEKFYRETINYLEESIKKNDEEMIAYNLRGFFIAIDLLGLGSISIRLAKKYLELENKYGNFSKFIPEDIY